MMHDLGMKFDPGFDGGFVMPNAEEEGEERYDRTKKSYDYNSEPPTSEEVLADLPTPHQLYDELSDAIRLDMLRDIIYDDIAVALSEEALAKFERKGWDIEIKESAEPAAEDVASEEI